MRVYLSGPMQGLPQFNFPAFTTAAAAWRDRGYTVINPAENFGGKTDLPRPEYIRQDIIQLVGADAIALLPGWQGSKGASLEAAIAKELELEFLDALTFDKYHETALDEAKRLVYGERQKQYAHPLDDYTCTAALWSAILGHHVTAEQAILCMIAVKVSRLARNVTHRDSITDVAGYAECLMRAVEERRYRSRSARKDSILSI